MKKLSTFTLMCVGLLAISGCGKKSEDKAFKPSLDANTACNLTVRGHYENFPALTEEFKAFKTFYPNVNMSYEYAKNHKKDMLTNLNGDTPADIFFTYSDLDYSTLTDFTEDLSDPALGLDLSCIRDNLIYKDAGNHIPYVPIYTTTFGMMINEDLFTNNGIAVPKTYEALKKACQDFKAKNYQYPMLGHYSMILYPLFFPHFLASILNNQAAQDALNAKSEGAGEYMRNSLTLAKDFMDQGFVNAEESFAIKDDYNATILRFFKGDIPMMLAKGTSFSGTEKRESESPEFSENSFKYSFIPVPSTDKGGYCYNTIELCFSVNKKSANLDMANEFMRFLLASNGLGINRMAKVKKMMTPCKDLSFDESYSAFSTLSADRFFAPSQFGLKNEADQQVRKAATLVCVGRTDMKDEETGAVVYHPETIRTIDDVIANFGSL